MKYLTIFCRVVVGSLFIVSGLIKVNDVIGFGYKLEEYFAESALNYPGLIPYVIPIAMFIVVGEVLLGVALLLGAWPKLTTSLIMFMTVFFLWLTNYTASCIDRREVFKPSAAMKSFPDTCVETCGCFGDAIPLAPRESFYKDVVLLILVLPVFIAAWRKKFTMNTDSEDLWYLGVSLVLIGVFSVFQLKWLFPLSFTIIAVGMAMVVKRYAGPRVWLIAMAPLLVAGYVQYYTYSHLPLKDYRAYAIGNNLIDQMKTATELGLPEPKTLAFYTLKNKVTGELKELDSDAYLKSEIWKDTTWSAPIADLTYTREVQEGYRPKIQDFKPTDFDGVEMKDSLLALEKCFWVISKDLKTWDPSATARVKAFCDKAQEAGIPVFAITSADYEQADAFRHDNQLAFPFLVNDGTELKIIIRSNPGLVYLEKAVVKNMWAHRDIPEFESASADKFLP
jgi:uncharacterized membrane protein YphA (DoxX/SURF4 family)